MSVWDKCPRMLKRIIIWIDEGINVLTNGRDEETVSSRVGRASRDGDWWAIHVFEPVIDFIFGKGHCKKNIETLTNNHE